jgi:hypothetical protein
MRGKNMHAERSRLVRPCLPSWTEALRDQSGATFGEVVAPHVRLEGTIFATPIGAFDGPGVFYQAPPGSGQPVPAAARIYHRREQ